MLTIINSVTDLILSIYEETADPQCLPHNVGGLPGMVLEHCPKFGCQTTFPV
jgi:hypothetical protein